MASNGSRVQVWKVLRDDDHFYGLGEKTGPLDKRGAKLGGTALVMWNSDVYGDRKSTRLNSSHSQISYAVFCLKKKKKGTQCAEKPGSCGGHYLSMEHSCDATAYRTAV